MEGQRGDRQRQRQTRSEAIARSPTTTRACVLVCDLRPRDGDASGHTRYGPLGPGRLFRRPRLSRLVRACRSALDLL